MNLISLVDGLQWIRPYHWGQKVHYLVSDIDRFVYGGRGMKEGGVTTSVVVGET